LGKGGSVVPGVQQHPPVHRRRQRRHPGVAAQGRAARQILGFRAYGNKIDRQVGTGRRIADEWVNSYSGEKK